MIILSKEEYYQLQEDLVKSPLSMNLREAEFYRLKDDLFSSPFPKELLYSSYFESVDDSIMDYVYGLGYEVSEDDVRCAIVCSDYENYLEVFAATRSLMEGRFVELRELKDFKGYYVGADGCVFHKRGDGLKQLAPRYTHQGYTRVKIGGKDYYIHRLVVQTFIGDIPQGMTVNHKNFIKDDNRVENLEILSMRDNIMHYINAKRKGEI